MVSGSPCTTRRETTNARWAPRMSLNYWLWVVFVYVSGSSSARHKIKVSLVRPSDTLTLVVIYHTAPIWPQTVLDSECWLSIFLVLVNYLVFEIWKFQLIKFQLIWYHNLPCRQDEYYWIVCIRSCCAKLQSLDWSPQQHGECAFHSLFFRSSDAYRSGIQNL